MLTLLVILQLACAASLPQPTPDAQASAALASLTALAGQTAESCNVCSGGATTPDGVLPGEAAANSTAAPSATWTAATTASTLPPTPTVSPSPIPATAEPSPVPPTETPTSPPPTPSGSDAVYIYVVDLANEQTCGESLMAVNTGKWRSGDVAADVRTALEALFVKNEYIAGMYNPAWRSNIQVVLTDFKFYTGTAIIRLEGTYVRSGDKCDDRRVRQQVWTTIRQFPGVKVVDILLNGNLLGDILASGQ